MTCPPRLMQEFKTQSHRHDMTMGAIRFGLVTRVEPPHLDPGSFVRKGRETTQAQTDMRAPSWVRCSLRPSPVPASYQVGSEPLEPRAKTSLYEIGLPQVFH